MVKICYNNSNGSPQNQHQKQRYNNVRTTANNKFERNITFYICSSTSARCLAVHFNLRQTLCLLRVTGKTRRIRVFLGFFSRESQFQNLAISRRSDQLPTCKTVQMQKSVPTRKATPRTIHGAASLAWTKQRYATAAANNITLGRRSLAMWCCVRGYNNRRRIYLHINVPNGRLYRIASLSNPDFALHHDPK